jgi:hypothetical protein
MIYSFDPGKVTGGAQLSTLGEFSSFEIEGGWEGFVDWFSEMECSEAAFVDATFIIEKFTIGAIGRAKTAEYDALYINGYLLGKCREQNYPVVQQTVTNTKQFATDAKLKRLGWYTPGRGHDRDAARHVLYYVRNRPEGQEILRRLV